MRSAAALRKPLRIDRPTSREKFSAPTVQTSFGEARVRASNARIVPPASTVMVTTMWCIGSPAGSGPRAQCGMS